MKLLEKFKVPIVFFLIFLAIGTVVAFFKDIRYFFMFGGIGLFEFILRTLIVLYPKRLQFFRLFSQSMVAGFLFGWLSLGIGVNFQFTQIVFDTCAMVVTGALIQTLIARLVLPFFLGNAFCSRACWTGLFFELTNSKKRSRKQVKRSEPLAWAYLTLLVALPIGISLFHNPALDNEARKIWIVGENLFIISIGFVLTFVTGSRSYCRLLCPFITISGLLSRFSLLKITPINHESCTQCNLCTEACPMLIDVKANVDEKKKISDRLCIVCERCVSTCPHNVLRLTNKKP